MGQKSTDQIKSALAAEVVKYLEMAKETKAAAIAHGEAERLKQALYAKEHDQGIRVVELWKKLNPNVWQTSGYVKLPDGRVVKIDNSLIWDCEVAEL